MIWSNKVVEHLENTCFHNEKTKAVLARESDKLYIEKLNEVYTPELQILDFGCGTARQLELSKIDSDDYTGYDSSEEMIKVAKEKFPDFQFSSNKDDIDIAFDIVISNDVLQHTKDLNSFKSLLQEINSKSTEVTILHFWYSKDVDKLQIIEIADEKFYEFFISLESLNKVIEEFNLKAEIFTIDNKESYPCIVLVIEK